MGIKRIGYGDKYKALGYSEYICDTESDLDLLPTNKSSKVVDGSVLPKCSAGSRAIVVESKKVYVLNTDGVWSEFIDHSGAGGGSGAVTSVNGKTGAVVLDASDVGALPDDTVIPPAVTEQTVSGWGFTKNTGTYSKPSGGIPASDLAQAVQDALDATSSGLTEDAKQALLDCFENVAWINDDGQTYYDALYAALYPPKTLVSISAAFNQGSAVIYETDSLDTLKQYLTVTATYDDSSTGVVTNYTLSGTLTEGTSTITVLYSGKTTTFNVTVSSIDSVPSEYQKLTYIGSTGTQYIDSGVIPSDDFGFSLELAVENTTSDSVYDGVRENSGNTRCWVGFVSRKPDVGWNTSQLDPKKPASFGSYEFAEVSANMFNNRKVYVGDVDCTLSSSLPTLAAFTRSFYLLGIHGSSGSPYLLASRLASARFTKGSEIIKNFIPVERKSDNVLGLYETVNGVFFTNDGTGTFVRGENA